MLDKERKCGILLIANQIVNKQTTFIHTKYELTKII